MAGSRRSTRRMAAKLAAGGLAAVVVPVALAAPAGAAYEEDDIDDVSITFARNGQTITCLIRGRLDYTFPVGDDETADISALTIVRPDPGCHDAVYQASLSGTYETTPDSGERVLFSAAGAAANGSTPGEFGVLETFRVPGPTGHIEVTHQVRFRCDNPPLGATYCTATANTSAK